MSDLKTISIDGVEYDYASMTDRQKGIIAQIGDLTSQMQQAQFRMDQLAVAKEGFTVMLKQSLETPAE